MSEIAELMLDRFDEYAESVRSPSEKPIKVRDMVTNARVNTHRLDVFDDITILHLDLNDELHEMTLMAIHTAASEGDPIITELRAHIDTELVQIYPPPED